MDLTEFNLIGSSYTKLCSTILFISFNGQLILGSDSTENGLVSRGKVLMSAR